MAAISSTSRMPCDDDDDNDSIKYHIVLALPEHFPVVLVSMITSYVPLSVALITRGKVYNDQSKLRIRVASVRMRIDGTRYLQYHEPLLESSAEIACISINKNRVYRMDGSEMTCYDTTTKEVHTIMKDNNSINKHDVHHAITALPNLVNPTHLVSTSIKNTTDWKNVTSVGFYDISNGNITHKMRASRCSVLVAMGDRVYIIGGGRSEDNDAGFLSIGYKYSSKELFTVPDLPYSICAASSAVINDNTLLIIGGYDIKETRVYDTIVSITDDNKWSIDDLKLPVPLCYHSAYWDDTTGILSVWGGARTSLGEDDDHDDRANHNVYTIHYPPKKDEKWQACSFELSAQTKGMDNYLKQVQDQLLGVLPFYTPLVSLISRFATGEIAMFMKYRKDYSRLAPSLILIMTSIKIRTDGTLYLQEVNECELKRGEYVSMARTVHQTNIIGVLHQTDNHLSLIRYNVPGSYWIDSRRIITTERVFDTVSFTFLRDRFMMISSPMGDIQNHTYHVFDYSSGDGTILDGAALSDELIHLQGSAIAASADIRMWVMGGYTDERISRRVVVNLHLTLNVWTTSDNTLPYPVSDAAAVCIEGDIYILGGECNGMMDEDEFKNQVYDTVIVLDPTRWEFRISSTLRLPVPLLNHKAVYRHGLLIVCGGMTANGTTNTNIYVLSYPFTLDKQWIILATDCDVHCIV